MTRLDSPTHRLMRYFCADRIGSKVKATPVENCELRTLRCPHFSHFIISYLFALAYDTMDISLEPMGENAVSTAISTEVFFNRSVLGVVIL